MPQSPLRILIRITCLCLGLLAACGSRPASPESPTAEVVVSSWDGGPPVAPAEPPHCQSDADCADGMTCDRCASASCPTCHDCIGWCRPAMLP